MCQIIAQGINHDSYFFTLQLTTKNVQILTSRVIAQHVYVVFLWRVYVVFLTIVWPIQQSP